MRAKPDRVRTPWGRGRLRGAGGPPRLLFRRMFEDWAVEQAAFQGKERIASIASGGCTAIALAHRGHDVTAIDINGAQIEHVENRLRGRPESVSASEEVLRMRRTLLPLLGVPAERVQEFLSCSMPERQLEIWDAVWSRRMRFASRLAFHPLVLRLAFDRSFVRALPPRFDRVLADRFRRGLALHPNHGNPFVWQMFLGTRPAHLDPVLSSNAKLKLRCQDMVEFLNGMKPGAFDAFTLSNILDGCDAAYAQALVAAVQRAAAPEAIVILRTCADAPASGLDWRRLDRSHLWGSVAVECIDASTVAPGGRFGRPLGPEERGIRHASAA